MLPWIIQMSIISLILIILVHYLFTFFMTNLTIPKVKDLVNKPQQQYEVLYNTMREQPKPQNESPDNESMKTELKNYLKELSEKNKNNNNNTTNTVNGVKDVNDMGGLMSSDSAFSSSSYSSF
jgi:hypothetical protein|tara:strand:+ start:1863 stop:2231 length:369 start_codon:yes stop_codon:yes gene_type:complete